MIKLKTYVSLGYYMNDPNARVALRVQDRASSMGVIDIELTPRQFRDLLGGVSIEADGVMTSMPEYLGRDNAGWYVETYDHEPSAEEIEATRVSYEDTEPELAWRASKATKKADWKNEWTVRFDGYAPREESA